MKSTKRPVDKREQDVKKKLSAAILMLLVSCIMVVTSTYAWFTLSTAPEVTGIQTTIGGNGNLEIALATGDTWADPTSVTTLSSTTGLTTKETNITWGNLVDVSQDYGVNLLSLTPAKLSLDETGAIVNSNYLEVPKYGSDGRVSTLAKDVMSAIYNGTAFSVGKTAAGNDNRGLRALGISAAMTARQSAWMSALSSVNNYSNSAKTGTSSAMQANGATLGSVAVKLATSSKKDTEKFTQEDFNAILALVTDTKAASLYIEDAIIAAIDATVASGLMQTDIDDTEYSAISSALATSSIQTTANTTGNITATTDTVTFTYDSETVTVSDSALATIITKYVEVANSLDGALTSLNSVGTKGSYYWTDIDDAVNKLMDINKGKITVAGYTLDEVKQIVNDKDTTALLNIANNAVVELGEDSGVYYTIASLVGSIKADIKLSVSAMGMTLDNVDATIQSTYENPLIPAARTVIAANQPSSEGSDEANIISDRYGFILDLLFRTNAADSDLLLQTTPKDRIYSDNENAETMGGGSTMTFTKSVASFSEEAMLNLINSIKLVFLDADNKILAIGGLDTGVEKDAEGKVTSTHYTKNTDGSLTVDIRLIDTENSTATNTVFLEDGSTITTGTDRTQTQATNGQVICGLTQNTPKAVSVLVYLDGEKVTNADVANAATSMTATINLQFASSAKLEPMEYSGLHQTTGTSSESGSTESGSTEAGSGTTETEQTN